MGQSESHVATPLPSIPRFEYPLPVCSVSKDPTWAEYLKYCGKAAQTTAANGFRAYKGVFCLFHGYAWGTSPKGKRLYVKMAPTSGSGHDIELVLPSSIVADRERQIRKGQRILFACRLESIGQSPTNTCLLHASLVTVVGLGTFQDEILRSVALRRQSPNKSDQDERDVARVNPI
ncbi:hypothetical protein KIPB_012371 [Kipferlia bialata]|uniref:Uncharacterized protein n=1 Tax=Kipferlia bialata TaxID=797122 RepID=A0A9K3D7R7_9EUKA|nr:hypothetical protein KIPB_012371 [Kipferlia bialata]|eukprot:g12371.t1